MRPSIIPLGLFLTAISGVSAIETFSLHSVQQTIVAEKNGQVVYTQSSDLWQSYSDQDSTANWGGSTNFDNHGDWLTMDTSADIYPYPEVVWNGLDEYRVSSTISALIEPAGSQCEIHTLLYDEWWGCRSYAEITNTTSGQRLFYADFFGGDLDGIYPLVSGDIYQIELYSGVTLGEGSWDYLFSIGSLNLAVLPAVIPSPPSLLLAVLGAAMLVWSKRHKPNAE